VGASSSYAGSAGGASSSYSGSAGGPSSYPDSAGASSSSYSGSAGTSSSYADSVGGASSSYAGSAGGPSSSHADSAAAARASSFVVSTRLCKLEIQEREIRKVALTIFRHTFPGRYANRENFYRHFQHENTEILILINAMVNLVQINP
jgi:hypothetical protein